MKLKRLNSNESGASAVEFAIILPVLLLLMFGIVQFGIAWNRAQGLQAAAREGARVASVGANYATIQSRVLATQSLFNDAHLTVSVYNSTNNGASWVPYPTVKPCQTFGSLVEVRVQVAPAQAPIYGVDIPLWGTVTVNYGATGQFNCEVVTN